MKRLGLPVIWSASYDAPSYGWTPPRRVADRLVHRAGELLVGLDAADGTVQWKTSLAGAGPGRVHAVLGDVFVTDLDRRPPKARAIGGFSSSGDARWETPLIGNLGQSWAASARALAIPDVAVDRSALLVVSADGTSTRVPVVGTEVIAEDDAWVIGRRGTSGGDALFRYADDGVRVSASDVRGGVWMLRDAGPWIVTVERAQGDKTSRLTVRDRSTLAVRWETVAPEVVAVDGDRIAFVSSSEQGPVPTVAELATGDVRWRGRAMAKSPGFVIAAGPLVVFQSASLVDAYTWDGAHVETSDQVVSRAVEVDRERGVMYLGVPNGGVCLSLAEVS